MAVSTDFNRIIAQATSNVAWKVLILGDIHLKKAGSTTGNTCVAKIPLLVARVLQYEFTHIVVGGDILHGDGYGVLEDQAVLWDMLEAAILAERPGTIFLKMVGNHEHNFTGSTPAEVYARLGIVSTGYYYVDIDSTTRFIMLNSMSGNPTQVKGPYSLGSTQRAWFTDLLAASTGKHIHVFSHVPLFGFEAEEWRLIDANNDPLQAGDYNPTIDLMLDYKMVNQAQQNYENIISWNGFHIHFMRSSRDESLFQRPWQNNWGAPAGLNWVISARGYLEWYGRLAGIGHLSGNLDGSINPLFIKTHNL